MSNFDCFMFLPWHCKLYFNERYCLRAPGVGRGQMGSGPLSLMKLGQNKHGNYHSLLRKCMSEDDGPFTFWAEGICTVANPAAR